MGIIAQRGGRASSLATKELAATLGCFSIRPVKGQNYEVLGRYGPTVRRLNDVKHVRSLFH